MDKPGEDIGQSGVSLSRNASELDVCADAEAPSAAGSRLASPLSHSLTARAGALLQQRQARQSFLPRSLFHEPAWELLLALYVARDADRPINVKHLVALVDAPITTSQRWIDQLAHMKLIHRVENAADRRRVEISLTDRAIDSIERYLESLQSPSADAGWPLRAVEG